MSKHISDLAMQSTRDGTNNPADPQPIKMAYTVREWCAVSGIGATKTYAEIKAGTLRSARVAGRRLILAEDGIAYLRAGRDHPKNVD